MDRGKPIVDAVISLTGFSLVGGPAYNDTDAAQALLEKLDVPYLAVQGLEFQSLQDWEASTTGLMPVEATMMVAIPELDGATGAMVFGGRSDVAKDGESDMQPHPERVVRLADRVERLVSLRRSSKAERKVAIVLFNFPPNSGATGTAAHLSVFESLFNTLRAMRDEGYSVELPESHEALRDAVLSGNATQFGAEANVHHRIPVDDHVRSEPWLDEIESQWGPAPGKELTDGQHLFILGESFGNVLVGIQPSIGYEGDPMRLLFEGGLAPTHAFSAFYRWIREGYGADAVLHFGTHGSLEFMPGKQVGLSNACWPDRLIADLPNVYLYAANNPSEGLIAKRRAASTLVSYLTPPVTHSDLYRHFIDLRASIDHWRQRPAEITPDAEQAMVDAVLAIATQCELCEEGAQWPREQWSTNMMTLRDRP
jgi:magnesium chelatase subunit H